MGNRSSSTAASQHEISGNGMSLFDIASLIVHDRMPVTPMTVPTCLDELVDWTDETTLTVNRLARAGINVFGDIGKPVCFVPLVKTDEKEVEATVVTQKEVSRFPVDCTFERTAFYHQAILICVQPLDLLDDKNSSEETRIGALSGLNFCIFLKLVRRLAQFVDLDDSLSLHSSQESESDEDCSDEQIGNECRICMARPQDTVLPCLHGVCSSCEAQWVEKHYDCPFCRTQFRNPRRRKRDQWQLEHWSKEDAEKDMADLVQQIQSFWMQHATGEKDAGGFSPLGRSFHESLVDDDFVLLS